jgi:DNA-binding CsgD family transcriptional regulator
LGIAATLRGDPERAQALHKKGLEMEVEMGSKADIAEDLEGLAEAAGALGEHPRAARLWGAANALREAVSIPWWAAERVLHEPLLIAARSQLDEAAWEVAFAEGQAMGLEQAVAYALSEAKPDPSTTPVPERAPTEDPTGNLTRREREVATLVARGLTNRQVAEELSISERTVANHVAKMLSKLGLRSRAQIATWANERKLLAPYPN